MKTFIFSILIGASMLMSCNKYLDIEPKGVRLLETIRDYDDWLNNVDVEYSASSLLNYLDDRRDILTVPVALTAIGDRIYTWQDQFVEALPGTAPIWSNSYKTIYLFNTVINNVHLAVDGTPQQKATLRAEALLGRALEYLTLVNLYSKVYDPATADKDLSVPFVTSVDVTDVMPPQNTVQGIYDHIISDINEAMPDLPATNTNNHFRGTVAAAHGLLARTYLMMGRYPEAAVEAQIAMDKSTNVVLDYTTLTDAKGIPHVMKRADAIYARMGGTSYLGSELVTQEFLRTFDTKDLRLKFFYTQLGDYSFSVRGRTAFQHNGIPFGTAAPNWGIAVAEMYLIIAEAAARNNETAKACDALDQIRKRRFLAANYVKFTSTDKTEVLTKVFSERGFELAFCGMRWFDMRRLDAEGLMPTVNRYNGTGEVIATLSPKSEKYTLKIPLLIMYFNPSWTQNK